MKKSCFEEESTPIRRPFPGYPPPTMLLFSSVGLLVCLSRSPHSAAPFQPLSQPSDLMWHSRQSIYPSPSYRHPFHINVRTYSNSFLRKEGLMIASAASMDCESVAKKIPGNAAGMFWRSSAAHLEKSLQRTATDDWSSHRERREALSKTSITLAPPRSKQYQLRSTKSDRMDGQNYSAQKLITPGTTSPQVNAVTEVSVLLKFLGNENASISASCCMARPRVELSTRNSNRNGISANGIPSTQNKTLKIVDIPLDELPFNNKAAADKKSTTKRREGKLPAGNSALQLQQHFWLNLAHTDSSGIGTSASESASSVNSSPRGIEKQNYCRDYRVISLDAKPRPGRLDDFVPEVERKNVENWSAIKPQQGRDHQCPKRNKGPTNAKLSDEEVSALERDEDGRLIIPSKEWRKFIAEQRPNTSVKLNSRLQLIHREEEWYKPKVIISNKGYQSSGNNGQCINSMKKEASSEPLPKMFHTIAIYGENTRTAAGIKMG